MHCSRTGEEAEDETHLGKVPEHPFLLAHRLGQEIERKALDLPARPHLSAKRITSNTGYRKRETHVEEHVLVLDEEFREQAQILAVQLPEWIARPDVSRAERPSAPFAAERENKGAPWLARRQSPRCSSRPVGTPSDREVSSPGTLSVDPHTHTHSDPY